VNSIFFFIIYQMTALKLLP